MGQQRSNERNTTVGCRQRRTVPAEVWIQKQSLTWLRCRSNSRKDATSPSRAVEAMRRSRRLIKGRGSTLLQYRKLAKCCDIAVTSRRRRAAVAGPDAPHLCHIASPSLPSPLQVLGHPSLFLTASARDSGKLAGYVGEVSIVPSHVRLSLTPSLGWLHRLWCFHPQLGVNRKQLVAHYQ